MGGSRADKLRFAKVTTNAFHLNYSRHACHKFIFLCGQSYYKHQLIINKKGDRNYHLMNKMQDLSDTGLEHFCVNLPFD